MNRKSAIVTGSTSGIGLAVANKLAEEGYNIILNGFGELKEIEDISKKIRTTWPVDVHFNGADMRIPTEIYSMVQECRDKFGSVDVLINNAGIQYTAPVEEFPVEKWDEILAVNLSSNFHTIQAVLPIMKEQERGRIVNISSVHGQVASVNKVAYVAAKHAVIGLSKVVALETANTAITCNVVCPGWVRTPLVQKQIDALAKNENISEEAAISKLLGEKQPSKKFVTPKQIGQVVAFLCTDAASEIRGATLNIDGGWLAQ